MRAEMTGATGEIQIVVFDGPQQVLRIISVPRKSYTEMTKADADRMGCAIGSGDGGHEREDREHAAGSSAPRWKR